MTLKCVSFMAKDLKSEDIQQMVILLHGYGSNAQDLINIAPAFAKALPRACFIAPNAPFPWEGGGARSAYQWFGGVHTSSNASLLQGVCQIESCLKAFIELQLSQYKLDYNKLVLCGFSQGAMVALHMGMRVLPAIGGVLAYSGMLIAPETLRETMLSMPPVMLIHGKRDDIIPVTYASLTQNALINVGVPVQIHIENSLEHAISANGIAEGSAFLRRIFPPDHSLQETSG